MVGQDKQLLLSMGIRASSSPRLGNSEYLDFRCEFDIA